MKKLILSSAIVLGSLSTFSAQAQEKKSTPTEQVPATDGYTEIKSEQVPVAVSESLKKAYPTATVNRVYVNDKKEYKLEVKVGDKEGALFAKETGEWIQK
jgi:hypothetical protein